MGSNPKKNILHYYVDLLRMDGKQRDYEQSETCVTALHNVIKTMQLSRHDKICGEDFSRLDFGNIPFNGIHWSNDGKNHCRFDSCKLNEWNFMSGHSNDVNAVAWSHDGKYILTGSLDETAILWDARSGLMMRKLIGHSDYVNSVAFSPDGKYCLTGSDDVTAKLWDFETGKCLKTFSLSDIAGITKWIFPYAALKKENICTIYKFDCFNPYGSDEPELIGSFYNIDGMHIKNCTFCGVTADETARKILYQYGGITTPDNEDRS